MSEEKKFDKSGNEILKKGDIRFSVKKADGTGFQGDFSVRGFINHMKSKKGNEYVTVSVQLGRDAKANEWLNGIVSYPDDAPKKEDGKADESNAI